MARKKLEEQELVAFLASHPGWGVQKAGLEKEFRFEAYADGIAFAVTVAMAAEQRDHHPDMTIGWAKVLVRWSTHDAGGVTDLDRELSERTDALALRHGARETA